MVNTAVLSTAVDTATGRIAGYESAGPARRERREDDATVEHYNLRFTVISDQAAPCVVDTILDTRSH